MHWKIWSLYKIEISRARRFKSSQGFVKRPQHLYHNYNQSQMALLHKCYSKWQQERNTEQVTAHFFVTSASEVTMFWYSGKTLSFSMNEHQMMKVFPFATAWCPSQSIFVTSEMTFFSLQVTRTEANTKGTYEANEIINEWLCHQVIGSNDSDCGRQTGVCHLCGGIWKCWALSVERWYTS